MDNIDLEAEQGFNPAGTCPHCQGTVYENKKTPQSEREVVSITRVCENHEYAGGDCEYYEEDSECPECGGELGGDARGPDRITGARSGKVECTQCDFGFFWSE